MSLPARTTPAAPGGADRRAEVAAFYLPQYHQVPENSDWWGEGFTEWTNVRAARPFYRGHRQPNVPGPLGYYDLTDPDVHAAQFELAGRHGVTALCHYFYWFGGRRLLQRPLELLVEHQDIDGRYFVCWANESWTRTWDGGDHELLVEQRHGADADAAIVDALAPCLADRRYVHLEGRPLLLIYRTALLDEPARTADGLRERADSLGLGELHLSMVQSFGAWDPRASGFDSAVEFVPHGAVREPFLLEPGGPGDPGLFDPAGFGGSLVSYPGAMEWALSKPVPDFTWFRTAMPGWDNTPRRGGRGTVFVGDTPELFAEWMERALHHTYLFNRPEHWLVFVNSWNEWGEGAHLEPDLDRGAARLEAVAEALRRTDPVARAMAGGTRPEDLAAVGELARTYYRSAVALGQRDARLADPAVTTASTAGPGPGTVAPATDVTASVVLGPAAHPSWLGAAGSVQTQDHPRTEVVWSDDPSRTLGEAFHHGARQAGGDLLLFCAGSDEYAADRVSSFVRAWAAAGGGEDFWGFSQVSVVDPDGAPVDLAASGLADLHHRTLLAHEEAWLPELLCQHDLTVTPANLVLTRDLYERSGGFPEASPWPGWELALTLRAAGDPVVVPRPLYRMRLDPVAALPVPGASDDGARRAFLHEVLGRQRVARGRRGLVAGRGVPFVDHLRARGGRRAPYSGG